MGGSDDLKEKASLPSSPQTSNSLPALGVGDVGRKPSAASSVATGKVGGVGGVAAAHQGSRPDELSMETEQRLDRLFKEIDLDKDGKIDIKDLTTALNKRGHKSSQLNAKVIKKELYGVFSKEKSLATVLNLDLHDNAASFIRSTLFLLPSSF